MQTSRYRQNQLPPKAVSVPAQKQKVPYRAPRKSRKARNRRQSLPPGGVRHLPLQPKVHQSLRLSMPQIPPSRRLILQHVHHVQQHSAPAAQPVPQGRQQQLLRLKRKFLSLLKQRHALHLRSAPAAQQGHPLNLNQLACQRPRQRLCSAVVPQEHLCSALHRLALPVSVLPRLALPCTGPLDQAPLRKGRLLEHPSSDLIPLAARQHSKRPIILTRRLDPSIDKEGRRPRPIVLALLSVPERHVPEHRARLHQDILRQPGLELDPVPRLSDLRSDGQPL
jgi:hypothetical protein